MKIYVRGRGEGREWNYIRLISTQPVGLVALIDEVIRGSRDVIDLDSRASSLL